LKISEVLRQIGWRESTLCVLSYLRAKLWRRKPIRNFEDYVISKFGFRLFARFFKTYTEKIWGVPCQEISSDWAAQRIQGMDLKRAVWNAFLPRALRKRQTTKSLIEKFRYPRLGPGMMWERVSEKIQQKGNKVSLGYRVEKLSWEGKQWVVTFRDTRGFQSQVRASNVVSSAALGELLPALEPRPPSEILAAAGKLRYRDFLIVCLLLKREVVFDDNWIYIHDPGVKVGRLQNFKAWSAEMVPEGGACLGMEYFCSEADPLWSLSDRALGELAGRELEKTGLGFAADVYESVVIRQKKAYPVYDETYQNSVEAIRRYVETHYPALHFVGRNGMHRYNNQDHSMMTGMLTAENILRGEKKYDVWQVNQDAQYHETINPLENGSPSLSPVYLSHA
jgi:protoporphyrinogen oxidase